MSRETGMLKISNENSIREDFYRKLESYASLAITGIVRFLAKTGSVKISSANWSREDFIKNLIHNDF